MHRQPGRTRSACQRTPWRANAEGICRAHSRNDVKGNRRVEKPKKTGSAGSVDGVRDPWSIGMAEAGASQKLLNARHCLLQLFHRTGIGHSQESFRLMAAEVAPRCHAHLRALHQLEDEIPTAAGQMCTVR